ncbi:MAG: VOC family protein [Actinomycetota bacterium]|nr:VOC family protein [Actinomycetota bacterium]
MAASDQAAPVVWPTTRCKDTRALIDFLVAAFGFEEHFTVPGEGGKGIIHAQIRWPGGGGVMFGDAESGDDEHLALPSGPISVYVVTGEPDTIHDRAVAAGATIVRDLRDEEYGSRGFSASDPEGNVWSFGTYAGD